MWSAVGSCSGQPMASIEVPCVLRVASHSFSYIAPFRSYGYCSVFGVTRIRYRQGPEFTFPGRSKKGILSHVPIPGH